jgi:CTP synthase (UTP-ammonia lyase)
MKLISKLSCSVVGQERKVRLVAGTQLRRIYGADDATEIFACNYGLNEVFADLIRSKDLCVSGYDEDGTARAIELTGHPFFISTLFVPQIVSKPGEPHPLIRAYLETASHRA